MAKKEKDTEDKGRIATHKRARFEFFIDERFEAGIVLQGWEVKALRQGRVAFSESYVLLKNNEAFLFGCQITPLISVNTHVVIDKLRTRKLLLHEEEIKKLIGRVEQRGYTLVPLNLHYKGGRIKLEIGLAKGKKQHDKRDAEKEKDWKREQQQLMKQKTKE